MRKKCVNQLPVTGHNTRGNEFTKKKVYSDSPVPSTTVSRLLWEPARLSTNPSGERKTVPWAGGEARSEEGVEGTRTHEVTSFLRDPPLKASSAFQLL